MAAHDDDLLMDDLPELVETDPIKQAAKTAKETVVKTSNQEFIVVGKKRKRLVIILVNQSIMVYQKCPNRHGRRWRCQPSDHSRQQLQVEEEAHRRLFSTTYCI